MIDRLPVQRLAEAMQWLAVVDRRAAACALVLRAVGLVLAGGLIGLLIDAFWPLSSSVRAVGLPLLVAGVVVGGWVRWRRLRGLRHSTWDDATRLEKRMGIGSNRLTNAVWLAGHGDPDASSLQAELTRRVVGRGAEVVNGLRVRDGVDLGPVRRAGIAAGAMGVVWVTLGWWQPHLILTGWQRWTQPNGDHPPFSQTRLAVRINPQPVVMGQSAIVTAQVTRGRAQQADLVTQREGQNEQIRWPMANPSPDRFTHEILRIAQPMTVWVETPAGARSQKHQIVPVVAPSEGSSSVRDSRLDRSAVGGRPGDDPARAIRDLQSRLDELATIAKRIRGSGRSWLNHWMDSSAQPQRATTTRDTGSEHLLEEISRDLARWRALHEQWLEQVKRVFGGATTAAGDAASPAEDRNGPRADDLGRIRAAADQVRSLGLVGADVGRLHRLIDHWATGTPGGDAGVAVEAVAAIAAAADQDLEHLGRINASMGQAFFGRDIPGSGQASDSGGADSVRPREGAYYDLVVRDVRSDRDFQAQARHAPVMYREMVGRYFRQLAEDQPAVPARQGSSPKDQLDDQE